MGGRIMKRNLPEISICLENIKKQLMRRDTSEMTQQLIDERDMHVQAKISTMKTIAKEYEKHYHNLTMVGEEKQIKYLIENFTSVMEVIHGLEASLKQEEESKK